MRRSLILANVLAVSTAVLGACDPKPNVPNKPAPVATATPVASPVASPTASPVKPGQTPDTKPVNKNVKLQGTPVKQ